MIRSGPGRSEEHTSELQSRVDISYAVFCLKKKKLLALHGHSAPCLQYAYAPPRCGFRKAEESRASSNLTNLAALVLTAPELFFNDTATTEIYPLSLHDALPISCSARCGTSSASLTVRVSARTRPYWPRSEEHTSELQSRVDISQAVSCLKQ